MHYNSPEGAFEKEKENEIVCDQSQSRLSHSNNNPPSSPGRAQW